MTASYSAGETIDISIDFREHPDAPGRVFDAVATAATLTLQHRLHDERHEFDADGQLDIAGQTLALELPPGTIETAGEWVYQGQVVLDTGRTLVWPRDPARLTITESIV
jgi:hypothetical protein